MTPKAFDNYSLTIETLFVAISQGLHKSLDVSKCVRDCIGICKLVYSIYIITTHTLLVIVIVACINFFYYTLHALGNGRQYVFVLIFVVARI